MKYCKSISHIHHIEIKDPLINEKLWFNYVIQHFELCLDYGCSICSFNLIGLNVKIVTFNL